MDKATGLIFLLFDIASSRDVPFCKPQYIQCTYHGLTFVLLCVPVLFVENTRYRFAIAQYGFPLAVSCFLPAFSVVTGFIAEKFPVQFFICSAVQQAEYSYK